MRARALLALALLAPLTLGACAGADQRGTKAERMAEWVRATSLGERVGQLRATADAVAELKAKPLSTEVLSTRCAVVLVDVQADNGDLPSPDRVVTDGLARAYTTYARAGVACAKEAKAGATAPSADVLRLLAAGGVQLLEALNRAEILTGRAIPTSTTRPPVA